MLGHYENIQDNYGQPYCTVRVNRWCHPHFHNSIELLYVQKGQVDAILNGHNISVDAGNFLIVPSYSVHRFITREYSYSYVALIPMQSIPSYQVLLSKQSFANCYCKDNSDGEMLHCLVELERLAKDKTVERSLLQVNQIKGYIYVLLSLVIMETGLVEYNNTRNHSLACDICTYLQENYQKNSLTLENLAHTFGYSKNRFSYIFHQYFGSGLVEYVNMLRCREAVNIMTAQKISVTDAALRVGFDNARTFYRAFQKCYGMTPSQYISGRARESDGEPGTAPRSAGTKPAATRCKP